MRQMFKTSEKVQPGFHCSPFLLEQQEYQVQQNATPEWSLGMHVCCSCRRAWLVNRSARTLSSSPPPHPRTRLFLNQYKQKTDPEILQYTSDNQQTYRYMRTANNEMIIIVLKYIKKSCIILMPQGNDLLLLLFINICSMDSVYLGIVYHLNHAWKLFFILLLLLLNPFSNLINIWLGKILTF